MHAPQLKTMLLAGQAFGLPLRGYAGIIEVQRRRQVASEATSHAEAEREKSKTDRH